VPRLQEHQKEMNISKSLQIKFVPIDTLKPNLRNPRQHSERQIKQIARSIQTFGFNVPILIDADCQVVAGHGRLLAACQLGFSEVPTISLRHLTPAQASAFTIADNRLAEISSWDDRLLGEVLRDLSVVDLGFSLEDVGFTMAEIDLRIEGQSNAATGDPDPDDQVSSTFDAPPVSRPGDLWKAGRHKILCGNAVDENAFEALMGGSKARIIFTDPPYNLAVNSISGKGRMQHREFAMASGEMSAPVYEQFLLTMTQRLVRHSSNGSLHYICIDWRHVAQLLNAGSNAFTELKNLCVWIKHNAGMGSLYRSQHELILVFKNGRGRHRNNVELGRHGRNRTNVWQYASVNDFGRPGEEGHLAITHPTVKPVGLIADAIVDSSARGDIVLDPFIGSGSTLIAAERVGRVCRGMELDPLYVDTAIRRWQRYAGGTAVHANTGKAFDSLISREGEDV
jgi:DNA modification methylase